MAARKSAGDLVDRYFWQRHANPRSVWSMVGAYLGVILAIYRRDRTLLAGTLLFVLVNPLVFSPPENDQAWTTRVVRGEQVFLDQARLTSPDSQFIALSAPVHVYALTAAARRKPLGTVLGTAASLALMLLFFDRMARLYEDHGTTEG